MPAPLRVTGLSKRYSSAAVFQDVDLEIAQGRALALTGPNGAGKSTLIGCVCGTVIPDLGEIEICGENLRSSPLAARRSLRYLPQEVDVPAGLTGREILEFHAGVFEVSDPAATVAGAERLADLGDAIELLATTYSVGMRRRLAFAAMACGEAGLYVLDEPFAGVDAQSRQRLLTWLVEQREAGAGILLAVHADDDWAREALEATVLELGAQRDHG